MGAPLWCQEGESHYDSAVGSVDLFGLSVLGGHQLLQSSWQTALQEWCAYQMQPAVRRTFQAILQGLQWDHHIRPPSLSSRRPQSIQQYHAVQYRDRISEGLRFIIRFGIERI